MWLSYDKKCILKSLTGRGWGKWSIGEGRGWGGGRGGNGFIGFKGNHFLLNFASIGIFMIGIFMICLWLEYYVVKVFPKIVFLIWIRVLNLV